MRVGVLGAGAVGARIAQHLQQVAAVDTIIVRDIRPGVEARTIDRLGTGVKADGRRIGIPDVDLLILATPAGQHVRSATKAVERGVHVLSVSDDIDDVQGLLRLGDRAEESGVTVLAGAGFSPGLTGVLARHAAARLQRVDEIHVAKMGTGGPACARQHHRALKSQSLDWRDGMWVRRPGGSGRELVWFPEPVDAHDCYRAELPDTVLLVPHFPGVQRVTARVSATRRDRLTMHLPMLRRPHPEGLVGAVRVEVRGQLLSGGLGSVIVGSVAAPAVGAAATAATAAELLVNGSLKAGAMGLSHLPSAAAFLYAMEKRGVSTAIFDGLAELAAADLDESGSIVAKAVRPVRSVRSA